MCWSVANVRTIMTATSSVQPENEVCSPLLCGQTSPLWWRLCCQWGNRTEVNYRTWLWGQSKWSMKYSCVWITNSKSFLGGRKMDTVTKQTLPAGIPKSQVEKKNTQTVKINDTEHVLYILYCQRERGLELEAGADPVELWPRHCHVTVVFRVVAGAAKSLLGQKHQVLFRQASVALHLSLVFHVDGIAQLRPKHLIWYEERHSTLRTAEDVHEPRRHEQGYQRKMQPCTYASMRAEPGRTSPCTQLQNATMPFVINIMTLETVKLRVMYSLALQKHCPITPLQWHCCLDYHELSPLQEGIMSVERKKERHQYRIMQTCRKSSAFSQDGLLRSLQK